MAERYRSVCFGAKTAEEIVREAVLELSYTAHDMAPFARDLGHVDEQGEVLPPFPGTPITVSISAPSWTLSTSTSTA